MPDRHRSASRARAWLLAAAGASVFLAAPVRGGQAIPDLEELMTPTPGTGAPRDPVRPGGRDRLPAPPPRPGYRDPVLIDEARDPVRLPNLRHDDDARRPWRAPSPRPDAADAEPLLGDPDDVAEGPEEVRKPFREHLDELERIRRADKRDEPLFIGYLRDANYPNAVEAVAALAHINSAEGRAVLREAMRQHIRTEVRVAAIRALARLETDAPDAPYRAILNDALEDPVMRAEAAVWAGRRRDDECFDALRRLHGETDNLVLRFQTGWALARLGDRVGWAFLNLALREADGDDLAIWAARGLGEMENTAALPVLYPLLERGSPLREVAAQALERYPEETHRIYLASRPEQERVQRYYRRHLLRYAMGLTTTPPPDLRQALLYGRTDDRMLALVGLARHARGEAIATLLDLLDAETRRPAERGDRRAELLALAKNVLRTVCAREGMVGMPGMRREEGNNPFAMIGPDLPDTNPMWRRWWFGQYRVEAVDPLRARLRDPLGTVFEREAHDTLPGGAIVENINADGRGNVVLLLGDRQRLDVPPVGPHDHAGAAESRAAPQPPAAGGWSR